MIRCRVLGPIDVSVDGSAAPPELLWRKNLALLVYLACSPTRGRSREHLIGLLWPDKPGHAARHSLNEALRPIRRCLGEEQIRTEADQIRLAPGAVRLDTEEFDARTAVGDWRGAAALVGGKFLEGLAVAGASGFEEWLTAEQRTWCTRTVDALLRCAEADLEAGRAGEARAVADRALAIDPLSEPTTRVLMRALALEGDRAGALKAYEDLRTRVEHELRARPGPETETLAERIRRQRQWRTPEVHPGMAATAERRRAPLMGREADLGEMWEVWRRGPASGKAAAVFIAGDAGVGKSRLADELMARVRLDGGGTAVIRAVEGDLQAPWSGLLGLARGGLLEAAGLAAAAPAALAWLGERLPEWADRFPEVRRVPPEAAPVRAFSEVLSAALGEQPVALMVDDAQWLDGDSLLALGGLLRDHARAPFFVVLTIPAGPARAELDKLQSRVGRDVDGTIVRLAPLEADAIRQLARWAVPAYEDAAVDRLTRRVLADSAGLPLLAVELLSAVALGLDLSTIQGTWPEPRRTLDQTLPGELPEGIVSALRVGFRRLSPAAQRTLQAAAVLGDRVGSDRLCRGSGLSPDDVTAALDELEWNRWLTAEGRGHSFVARIVRDVIARDQLTEGQRRRILAAVAGPPLS